MSNDSHTKLMPYQSDWLKKFQAEKEILKNLFGDKALEIEHIGSTSIEGLPSKPIIDIAVMIEDHKDADAFTEPLTQIGYRCQSPSSTERHFYIKEDSITYHLSMAYADRGGFWKRQILFRDYLRKHPEALHEYATLKTDLLKNDPTGQDSYITGKSEFVYKILGLAGWEEGQKYR